MTRLVVKGRDSGFLATKARAQTGCVLHPRERHSGLKLVELPLFPNEVKGIERLKPVAGIHFEEGAPNKSNLTGP